MDEHVMVATRHSLHAVAERLLAGPQYRETGEIRLQVTPGGFGQFTGPLRVEGAEIVGPGTRVPLRGRIGDIAAELYISAKTASVHVSNILRKLGVANRVEAAAAAHRLRLLDG